MRWQAPSERTQMILLAPILVVVVPPLYLMMLAFAGWDKFCTLIAPSAEWHPWFAWRPVQHYNDVDWIWLERAERRWSGSGLDCFYRFAQGMAAAAAGETRSGSTEGNSPVGGEADDAPETPVNACNINHITGEGRG